MEFLAYAMTDESFQDDLNKLDSQRAVLTTNLPESKKLWSKIGLAIAKLIGLDKVYFRQNKTRQDAPFNFLLEIASSFNDILAKPTEPIYLSPFSAKTPPKPKQALTPHKAELGKDNTDYHLTRDEAPITWRERLNKMKGNVNTWRNAARIFHCLKENLNENPILKSLKQQNKENNQAGQRIRLFYCRL
jgi:hypothetical protein